MATRRDGWRGTESTLSSEMQANMNLSDQQYIDLVFSNKDFPKHPRYFFIKEKFYVAFNDAGQKQAQFDFVNSQGQKMTYIFYFDKDRNAGQIFPTHLIIGTKFI